MSLARVPFSVWALVAFVVLLLLQVNPVIRIILSTLRGPELCGLAAHAFLLGLLVEGVLRRSPRFLMIIPLVAYGAYYVMYAQQSREIAAEARQMQLGNPAMVLQFDPSRHSLVLPQSQAKDLASYYAVPTTYVANPNFRPEGYLSYRLLDREQCARARDAVVRLRGRPNVSPAAVNVGAVRFENVFLKDVCLLWAPEKPALQQIVVTHRGDDEVWKRKRTIMEQFVDFSLDGKVFATYRTASVWRLPILPTVAIACGSNGDKPAWECFTDFDRSYELIDGAPKGTDKTLHDSPESIVLGLRKYKRNDYATFTGDKRSSARIDRIDAYPQEQAEQALVNKAELFAQFAEFVRDSGDDMIRNGGFVGYKGTKFPPDDMADAIAANVGQLIPLRDAIVARFVRLAQANTGNSLKWYRLLDRALVHLPRDAYVTMPDLEVGQLLDALASQEGNKWFADLYEKMADAGPRTLSFYETDLAKGRSTLAALAVCRIGQASEQTRAILRAEFMQHSKSDANDVDVGIASRMFVALLKLGDAAADANPTNLTREDVIGWYEALRQGKGRTDIGPNNCQGWDEPGHRYIRRWLPYSLRPALVYNDGRWTEAATQ